MSYHGPLHGQRVHPFAAYDVAHLLADRAKARGEHPFMIWSPFEGPDIELSYAAFEDQTARLANGLAARGIRAGDFLLIHLENCLETSLAWYACARLGAIAVTTNARSAGQEVAYFAQHCGAKAAITQPKFAEMVNENCPDLKWIALTAHDNGAPPAQGTAPEPSDSFEALFADEPAPLRPPDPDAPAAVQYTSGTTSRPKGVLWTHANALWGGQITAAHQDLRPEDRHLAFLPLFHTNAQIYSVMAALWVGATAIIMPKFSASRFWPLSLKHRATWCSVVPFCERALLEHDVPTNHHYRLWGSGYCSPETDAVFGVKTIGWWGMTETMTHGIIGNAYGPNRSYAIGRPSPVYDIFIEHDDGTPAQPGETANLLVGGVPGISLFKEYLNNPEATSNTYDAHGRFMTGDRVTLFDDGYIKFADREKDMLRVGGENVAASEIEAVVMAVPGVKEASVVGKKDRMLDEVPAVFVVASNPDDPALDTTALAARIEANCADALADFKQPREIRFVESLPRGNLEKINKVALRQMLAVK